jgi:uncharacterized protein
MRIERITWVVKASKFCNMRCSYCYEWNELDDRTRMSMDLLRKLFVAIRTLHDGRRAAAPSDVHAVTRIVLHGGEPLILPLPYLRHFFESASEVLGERLTKRDVEFSVQTNLLAISDPVVELLERNKVAIGVSFDMAPGVRRTLAGGETETRVLRNLDRLRERGLPLGAICVLARHTAPRITEIHDFFAGRRMSLRVLPLFTGPDERPDQPQFSIDNATIIQALDTLFRHWFETGVRIRVDPLAEWFENVLRKMLGARRRMYDRRRDGDAVILVNTDGRLYRVLDAYEPALSLGDLKIQTIDEVLTSEPYRLSLLRDDALSAERCATCGFAGACNGWPIFASRQSGEFHGRCPITFSCQQAMEGYLRDTGFEPNELCALLVSALREQTANPELAVSAAG